MAREYSLEFFLQESGVIGSKAEGDERPEVSDDSIADFFVQLVEILMGQDHTNPVFPEFRGHVDQGKRGEGLKLVSIEEEVPSFILGDIRTAESRQAKGSHEEPAQKERGVFSQFSFGQVDDEDLAFVHDPSETQIFLWFGEDLPNDGICEKRPNLVLDRRDGFGAHPVGIFGVLLLPKFLYLLIGYSGYGLAAVGGIIEELKNVGQSSLRLIKKSEQTVAENMLHPDAPGIIPLFLENFENARGKEGAALGGNVADRVVSDTFRVF